MIAASTASASGCPPHHARQWQRLTEAQAALGVGSCDRSRPICSSSASMRSTSAFRFNAVARLANGHRQTADWFPWITRVEVQSFDTRAKAIAAETGVIRKEHPKFNRAGVALTTADPPIEQSVREFRELLTTNGCHFKSYRGGNILTVSRGKQFERFVQTARKLGVNESMEDFTVKFRKIVPPKRPKQSQD